MARTIRPIVSISRAHLRRVTNCRLRNTNPSHIVQGRSFRLRTVWRYAATGGAALARGCGSGSSRWYPRISFYFVS